MKIEIELDDTTADSLVNFKYDQSKISTDKLVYTTVRDAVLKQVHPLGSLTSAQIAVLKALKYMNVTPGATFDAFKAQNTAVLSFLDEDVVTKYLAGEIELP